MSGPFLDILFVTLTPQLPAWQRMEIITMIKGRIHSLESFGAVDGPGIRYLIFLKGCNMRCQYCHNVDTWNPDTDNLMTADELLDKAERFRSYWGKEGGITVSGGEALLQIDFSSISSARLTRETSTPTLILPDSLLPEKSPSSPNSTNY